MGKKSNTDVELYDVLLDKFQKITSKMKHISPGDEEIGQKLIREQAKKVQAQIVAYLKNRTKHGLELTDEMIAFKGLETKLKELHFEIVIKPQLRIADSNRRAMDGDFIPPPSQEPKLKPEDIAHTKEKYSVRYKIPTDGEQVAMVNKIKSQSKKIKALKIFGKMPDKDTMVKIIDDCRFKTTEKCNDSAVGRKIGKDSETAKRWIEKLGLSYYAYNPKHER